jgi:GntR family transcriptional regulator of arabinose operon
LYEILDQYDIPYVFIQGKYAQLKNKPHILLDDCKGGYLVTQHLISLGHRDIVGVFKADDIQGQQRHKGYVRALQEAGINYDPDKVIWFHTEDRKTHPYQLMRQIAANRKEVPFTAVVAYNDQTAVKILQALEEEGLTCPDDISITGYDNSYLASSCKVPLTTIAHPQEKLGEMAAELLLQLIQNSSVEKEKTNIVIEPELVVRDSCRAI